MGQGDTLAPPIQRTTRAAARSQLEGARSLSRADRKARRTGMGARGFRAAFATLAKTHLRPRLARLGPEQCWCDLWASLARAPFSRQSGSSPFWASSFACFSSCLGWPILADSSSFFALRSLLFALYARLMRPRKVGPADSQTGPKEISRRGDNKQTWHLWAGRLGCRS